MEDDIVDDQEWQEEVAVLRSGIEILTSMVQDLVAAQNPPLTQAQTTVISEIETAQIPAIPVTNPTTTRPYGIDMNFQLAGQQIPVPHTIIPQAIMTATPAIVNTVPLHNEQIFHGAPSEGMGRLEEFEDQFLEMQKEIKALRGKDLFGKEVNDLCLVLNVRVPPKFRLPEFEKYKGNSCPHSHLIITHIRTFHDLGEAFIRQYKYNIDMAPDRDQLRAMSQKEKDSFKEYVQRWRKLAAQIIPPMEEKEMTKVFLKTLSTFYYVKMVASAPNDSTEIVNMGMRLEEGIREGGLIKEAGSSLASGGVKRFGGNFAKKKEETVDAISRGRKRRYQPQQIAVVTPVVSQAPPQNVQKPQPQQPRQQAPQQNQKRKYPPFDPILMTYTKLLPFLLQKNLVQLRDPPPPPANPPFWYKVDARCAFHKNASGHTVENCYPLMSEVHKLVRNNMLTFKDVNPNVQNNPLPNHGTVNAIHTQFGYEYLHDVRESTRSLVQMHIVFCGLNYFPPHNYSVCSVCLDSIQGCETVINDLQKLLDRGVISISRRKRSEDSHSVNMVHGCPGRYQVWDIRFIREPLVLMHIRLCWLAFFQHDHNACKICSVNPRGCRQVKREIQKMLDERTLHITYERDDDINMVTAEFPVPEIVEISYDSQNMTVVSLIIQMPKPFPYNSSTTVPWRYGTTIITGEEEVNPEPESTVVNIADVSHMTRSGRLFAPIPPKPISLSVQVPPPKDVPREGPVIPKPVFETKDDDAEEFLNLIKKSDYKVVDQLLQTQSKISLLALLVHLKAHRNALMNVLKQAYIEQDATLEQFDNVVSNITVNNVLSFSREELPPEGLEHNHARTVIGEVDLPIRIGPQDFEITFQIMDIYPAYSYLLRRPWIHSAGAVTSTLHQMLKFAIKDKLITVYGEQTMFKDAQRVVAQGSYEGWGQVIELPTNKNKSGLGFTSQKLKGKESEYGSCSKTLHETFQSVGYINPDQQNIAAIIEDVPECSSFVTRRKDNSNWTSVNISSVVHESKLSLDKPAENNDPRPSPKFEYHVYEAEEESNEEIPKEITRLLEHEEKIIELHKEPLEVINLGTEKEKREVRIGALLETSVK
ncbi:uncharacterized protein LOC131624533 [Vicia villosa]|uniref:uncharacterized protein LOC131624533 n=1 Tax=Vicia villosa TaxID=3911 RepID=UPI00273CC533|nr:uncharacterized protein LOC131624533 [Vicia villosa]